MLKATTRLRGNLDKDMKRFEEFVQSQVTFSGVAGMAKVIYENARAYAPRSERAHLIAWGANGKGFHTNPSNHYHSSD